jgi:TonB family protein
MNDMNKTSSALFTPSGCLTGDTMMLLVSGSLKGSDLASAQQHVFGCPLCADAADGLRMWLKENESADTISPSAKKTQASRQETLEGKHTEFRNPDTHKSRPQSEFHTRTNILNDRIRQRLHTHAMVEDAEKKRLSYKPFVWMAVAATIVLFIGGFGVVWMQNKLDAQKLAQERADEMLMLESPAIPDTLSVVLPENRVVIAIKDKKLTGTKQQLAFNPPEIIDDSEIMDQDALNSTAEAVAVQESGYVEVVEQSKEEPEVVSANKTATLPMGKNARSSAYKTENAQVVEDQETVFTIVEEMPSFPGGETARNKYLAENLVYPKQATESGIEGTVFVSFIVDTKGNITEAKVLRGIGGGCDEEALRVIKLMPRWKPGRQNGKFVRVLFNMPLYFKLNG